jgi:hypothetical protein
MGDSAVNDGCRHFSSAYHGGHPMHERRNSQRVAAFLLIAIFLAFLVFSRGRLW